MGKKVLIFFFLLQLQWLAFLSHNANIKSRQIQSPLLPIWKKKKKKTLTVYRLDN